MNYLKYYKKHAIGLENRIVFVTGSTGILGQNFIRHILKLRATVIISARNEKNLNDLNEVLLKEFPNANIDCVVLDISKAKSIDSAVRYIEEKYPTGIDFLVNNAGIFNNKFMVGESGFEITFETNFLGTFNLTKSLIPSLEKKKGRVVCVSSVSSKWVKCDFSDIDFKKSKSKMRIYSNSKRCLNFSMIKLFESLNSNNVSLSLVHPGVCATNIIHYKNGGYSKGFYKIAKAFMKLVFMSPKKASLTLLMGMFENFDGNHWIAPRGIYGIWGKPKVKRIYKNRPKLKDEQDQFFKFMVEKELIYKI